MKRLLVIAALLSMTACRGGEEGEAPEREGLVFTHFTEATELFVEFDALAVGAESPFAAHLTRLSDYKPLERGVVTAILSEGGSPEERFTVDKPSVPGIFRPVAKPQHAGQRRLTFLIESPPLRDVQDLGIVNVFPSLQAAIDAAPKEGQDGGGITYLKEQQWRTEFGVGEVSERTMRAAITANGVIRARPEGDARITAPAAGRVLLASAAPRIGMRVSRNQLLAAIAPRLDPGLDIATLRLEADRARLEVQQAERDRERLERLFAQEAVPERRVLDARHREAAARAAVAAANARLSQYVGLQSPSDGGSRLEVRSPINSVIASIDLTPGELVEEGAPLFHIVDLRRLWIDIRVPEAHAARAQTAESVWFAVEGIPQAVEVSRGSSGRLIGVGGVVDPKTRTVPVIFEFPNTQENLRVGMFARAQLFTGTTFKAIAIPRSAVVDEDGQPVAYVMVEGETFERRPLKLGVQDREFVQVIEGLQPGERIVTKGAYNVRLAAASGAVPAHGHAH